MRGYGDSRVPRLSGGLRGSLQVRYTQAAVRERLGAHIRSHFAGHYSHGEAIAPSVGCAGSTYSRTAAWSAPAVCVTGVDAQGTRFGMLRLS